MTTAIIPATESKFDEIQIQDFMRSNREVSSIDILTINNIFCVVSKKRRNALTEVSEINPKYKIEKHINREFRTPLGFHVIISGPVLSHFDATLSSILIGLYFEFRSESGLLICSYADLNRKLSRANAATARADITRSFNRLTECNIKVIDNDGEQLWNQSIIERWQTRGKGRGLKLHIHLNENIVPHFNQDGFSLQILSILASLSGEYEPALYRLISTSNCEKLELKLCDLYNFFSEKGSPAATSWESLSPKQQDNFRTSIKKAIQALIRVKILHPDSSVVRQQVSLISLGGAKKISC